MSRTDKVPALIVEKPGNESDKETHCSLDEDEFSGER